MARVDEDLLGGREEGTLALALLVVAGTSTGSAAAWNFGDRGE